MIRKQRYDKIMLKSQLQKMIYNFKYNPDHKQTTGNNLNERRDSFIKELDMDFFNFHIEKLRKRSHVTFV